MGGSDTNEFPYVDMGEAGIWATCNVGATKPEEYGLYFAWGETEGYKSTTDKSGGFTWNSYKFGGTNSGGQTKYNDADGLTTLELEDDAAHVIMGGDWRIPTKDKFQALYDACDVTIVWNYNGTGVCGELFTLKTDSSKQLFFPAAGAAYNNELSYNNNYGYYWSSSLYRNSHAYILIYYSNFINAQSSNDRYSGLSVRAILNTK